MDEKALSAWCTAAYKSWGVKHQGLVSSELLIPKPPAGASYDEDPSALLHEVFEFSDWATHEANFLPGEFSLVGYASRCVEGYIAAVNSGGHVQFLSRYRWDPIYLEFCEQGLRAMGCQHHLSVFQAFRSFVGGNLGLAVEKVRVFERNGARAEEFLAFDQGLLGGPTLHEQVSQQARWLVSTNVLRPVGMVEMQARKAFLRARNSQFSDREQIGKNHHSAPRKNIVRLAASFEKTRGIEMGVFWQSRSEVLTTFELGADPVPVVMWRFAGLAVNRQRAVRDIVIVPPVGGRQPRALLSGTDGDASVELSLKEFQAAMRDP